ncbi:MAG: VCBS repeat-containing protein [Phycisphaeraceae bacterium]|nr:VCBS repeat-containing protein [Phycisphaerales bacterium]MCB9859881.1 VCBS repeat-containing protein [Phycisphaeraceae bacterium]
MKKQIMITSSVQLFYKTLWCLLVICLFATSLHAQHYARAFPGSGSVAGARKARLVGDLDGDGIVDAASASLGLHVYLGNKRPGFDPEIVFANGINSPGDALVTSGDFDNDGDIDLLMSGNGEYLLYVNDGLAFFSQQSRIEVVGINMSGTSLAGDIDLDGNVDAVILGYGNNAEAAIVLFGDGFGNFADPVIVGLGNGAADIKLADMDSDGDLDIVASVSTQQTTGRVAIGKYIGNQAFASVVHYVADRNPTGIDVVDIDNDTDLDVVAACYGSDNIVVLENDGAGGLSLSFGVGVIGEVRAISVADLDNDLDPDFIVTTIDSDEHVVIVNNGNGVLTETQRLPAGSVNVIGWTQPVDLDCDGDIDIVRSGDISIGTFDPEIFQILINQGNGTFESCERTSLPENEWLIAADVNFDGNQDLLCCVGGEVTPMLNDGLGTFTKSAALFSSSEYPMEYIDINKDGIYDIVMSRFREYARGVRFKVAMGTNTGSYTQLTLMQPPGNRVGQTVTGDFDNNGYVDIASVVYSNASSPSNLAIWENDGEQFVLVLHDLEPETVCLAAGDINNDTLLDIVACSRNRVQVLKNRGDGSYSVESVIETIGGIQQVALVDLNNDGLLDICAAGLYLYSFAGDGSFQFELVDEFITVTGSANALIAEDVDSNGTIDILMNTYTNSGVCVVLGHGDGTFEAPTLHSAWPRVVTIAANDFDGDCSVDVVACGRAQYQNDSGVSLLRNHQQALCYADCDNDKNLDIFDYICFGNAYSASELYADCDGNGLLNVFDYICFGNAYAAGCP